MSTIALLINNQKEKTVLEHYFQNINYNVLLLKSNFTAYREISHSIPICIICEIPYNYLDNIYVIRLLENHRNTKEIPVIGYGNHSAPNIIESLYESGVHLYYQRPLQIKNILQDIKAIQSGQNLKIKRYRSDIVNEEMALHSENDNSEKKEKQQTNLPAQQRSLKTKNNKKNELTVPLDELEAIEMVMDPITTPEERIEIIISRVKKLLAFPFTIIKIIDISQNDKTGADDLSKAIEADPVIISTLLSVSNTVHFSRGGKRISEVKEAIVRLGFVETKNIAISLSVMNIFSNEARSVGFNRYEFWYHSLACGIVSEIVARRAGYPRPEIAFICGLLHDFGIILLDEFFHSFFLAILSQVIKNKGSFITEERRLWGMSHNTAVGFLFKEWNMPSEVTNAIGQQDICGIKQLIDRKNPESLLVNIIEIGNLVAKCFQFGKDCDSVVHPLSKKTLEILNLSEGITGDLINKCIDRLNIYSEFFGLDRRFFSYPPEPEPDSHILNFIMHTDDIFNPYKYYLQTCGYKITQESSIEGIKSLKPQPHAIVHVIDKSTPLKTISPFLNIQKVVNYDIENKPDSFIPSIFISHDDRLELKFDNVNHAYSLPTTVDVNLLSFIIEGLISKQNIRNYFELIEPTSLDQQREKRLTIQYLDKSVVLITLQGSINLSYFNELKKCFTKMIEKKVPHIAIQLSNIIDIDNIIVNLLVNFQRKADDNGCNLCFCNIGKKIPGVIINHNALKSVHVFDKESDAVAYFTS